MCGRRAQRKFLDLGGSAENQGDLKVRNALAIGQQPPARPPARPPPIGGRKTAHPSRFLRRAQSVVLHKMTLGAHKSTFPIALGVRLTGVDDSTFSQTGGLRCAFNTAH